LAAEFDTANAWCFVEVAHTYDGELPNFQMISVIAYAQ
jgi:hypothetical protein